MKRKRVELKEAEYTKKCLYIEDIESIISTTWIEDEDEKTFTIGKLIYYEDHEEKTSDKKDNWYDDAFTYVDDLELVEWMDTMKTFTNVITSPIDCRRVYSVKKNSLGGIERNRKCCLHRYKIYKNKEHVGKYLCES